ncbi:MAG: sulfatase [Lentisphaeraceae bacterium]|nr:sulfatase [Lentisphaeraceae bacterium]
MKVLLLLLCFCSALIAEKKTNFIVIFADDMGYADLECFGAPKTKTPNLNKMAAEGMKMTDFHVASPVCSPSRGALMTGRYPHRIGIAKGVFFPHSKNGMPSSEITIAEMLKEKNYNTALFGKWHLGHQTEFLPRNQGFDYYYGIPYSNDMHLAPELPFAKDVVLTNGFTQEDVRAIQQKGRKIKKAKHAVPLMRNDEVIEFPCDQNTITKRLTEEVVKYIGEKKNEPFFIYMAHPMPHIPLYASPAFKGKSANGFYGDVIEEMDWSVGQVLKAVKDNGIEENTFVIFTSDNGPWLVMKSHGGSAGDLRNGKGSTYEGGMRVPCIVKYPAAIKAGQTSSTFATTMDILPTIAELAGISVNHKIDGHSMSKIMNNTQHSTSYDYFLHTSTQGRISGIRQGNWKLLFDNPHTGYSKRMSNKAFKGNELYQLTSDVAEEKNLASTNPEKVQQMKALALKQFQALKNK